MENIISNRKELPRGTEVLIFRYTRNNGVVSNDEYYIRGTVLDCKVNSENELTPSILTVLGEDGCEYWGSYGNPIIGNSYFRTKEDQIAYLENCKKISEETIEELKELIIRHQESIDKIANMQPRKQLRILHK